MLFESYSIPVSMLKKKLHGGGLLFSDWCKLQCVFSLVFVYSVLNRRWQQSDNVLSVIQCVLQVCACCP